jgi:hypothetical protein
VKEVRDVAHANSQVTQSSRHSSPAVLYSHNLELHCAAFVNSDSTKEPAADDLPVVLAFRLPNPH